MTATTAPTRPPVDGPPQTPRLRREPDQRVNWPHSIPFLAAHLVCLAVVFTGVSWTAVALFVGLFVSRSWFVTAGYHRYFSHRSYRLNRFWQAVFAFQAQASAQKGVLWWASKHRQHHRHADTPLDVHSPRQGFVWSHVGWILSDKHKATDYELVKDLARYPELRWLNRHDRLAAVAYGVAAFLVGGWPGLVVGFFWSTVLLWHTTFLVNSAAHVFGGRRYDTPDTSRNSWLIALATLGEGWHNNHHRYQASARQGFFWWELDLTWYVLRALSWVGVVRDLKTPPARILNPSPHPASASGPGARRSRSPLPGDDQHVPFLVRRGGAGRHRHRDA